MSRRKKAHASGGHGGGWVVSFADLMSLLMAFFVMLLSFSDTDKPKFTEAAGSLREAFGVSEITRKAGMIEREGNPERDFAANLTKDETKGATEFATTDAADQANQGQEANTFAKERTDIARAAQFAYAAASIKQAWQDQPDITNVADNLLLEETEEGLNIIIADQDGRAMFPEGSKYPYEITRQAIAALAPALQKLPNQIQISGHTAAGAKYPNPRYGAWELSFDRANSARQILEEFGLKDQRIASVVGRAESDPFFPNDPYLSANQRVSILVMFEQPPVPVNLEP